MAPYHFILSFLITIPCLTPIFSSGAAVLAPDEVAALGRIARTLGKTNWDFSVDPCSGQSGWANRSAPKGSEDAVNCNCSYSNSSVCHVVGILLKSQSLPGKLPAELTQLPFIQEFDVTRNYLNGTIPPEWGSLPLVNISIQANRISGPIPKEFGNISTLLSFTAEYNELSGNLPPELGNLSSIQRFFVSSNKLTGELPASFANLTTLLDFRISDNQFNGSIPNIIQNWRKLQRLEIRASGFTGPIPYGISQLVNLNELRISDLNGTTTTTFPPLVNLTNLGTLVLKRCNILGELPDYLWKLSNIKLIDFSFNHFMGAIPESYSNIYNVKYIILTGNLLSGPIPGWMTQKGENIDLSYNNLTLSSSSSCQLQQINVFGTSFGINNTGIVPCLKSHTCDKQWYSFNINCGGKKFTDGNITYEEDTDPAGAAKFYISPTNWAFSSTGFFLDGSNSYTMSNVSQLAANASQLYYSARTTPLSLTYYGFCLGNGNYTVKLHFAELQFSNDNTYYSLGKRIFDVYVQDELVLKNFNGAAEAGGVGVPLVMPFQAVVDSGTLSVRFEWAGRGTTTIPVKAIYGPLISAISVIPNFMPPPEVIAQGDGKGKGKSVVVIVSVVVAASAAVALLVATALWWNARLRRQRRDKDLKDLNLQTGSFTLRQIIAATNDFNPANKIGEGGFGPVYKGTLADGTVIAVKQLSSKSKQGNQEFVNEIGTISALQHPHLVKLYGCCMEGNQLLLIYEYMPNNSLARALFGPDEYRLELDWPTRQKICVGIAKGLTYLHEECTLKIVHRDIKATNVLLDEDLTPKISDFGLAKLDVEDGTHISTRIAGTFGYMAPEYAMRGHLTDKADVYSFGIVALEIVSGKSNTNLKARVDNFYLLDWALQLKAEDRLIDLVDPRLESNFDKEEAMTMIKVGLLCTDALAVARPPMSYVVQMLEGRIEVQEVDSTPNSFENEMKRKELRGQLQVVDEYSSLDNKSPTENAPWTTSSSSDIYSDLYPVNLDSQYWEKRI